MPPEKQCVSLELAQEMKVLGFPQESLFYWNVDKPFIGEDGMYSVQMKNSRSVREGYSIDEFSAYTVAELIEEFKKFIPEDASGFEVTLTIELMFGKWRVVYGPVFNDFVAVDYSLADALAKTLIYLKKNNLI